MPFESLWAVLIPVNFLISLASRLISVGGFLFELKYGNVALHFFILCRSACYISLPL